MHPSIKTRKRILIVAFGIYLCFIVFSILAYNFIHYRSETFAYLKSLDQSIANTRRVEPTSAVLGIYNSVTLTPTPLISEQTTEGNINRTKPARQPVRAINKNEVYSEINNYRAANGLPPVTIDARLEISAHNKAKDMVNKNYFEHGNPWSFISATGYKFNYAAENLAVNYYTSNSIVIGWKASPGHNKAMLDARNQHMGFAYLCGIKIRQYSDTCLAVIHFGREQN